MTYTEFQPSSKNFNFSSNFGSYQLDNPTLFLHDVKMLVFFLKLIHHFTRAHIFCVRPPLHFW